MKMIKTNKVLVLNPRSTANDEYKTTVQYKTTDYTSLFIIITINSNGILTPLLNILTVCVL